MTDWLGIARARENPSCPHRNRKFADSLLEGAVTSEPVSEAGNSLLAGKIQGISLDFAARHASIAAKEQ